MADQWSALRSCIVLPEFSAFSFQFSIHCQLSVVNCQLIYAFSSFFRINSTPKVPGPQWQETVQPACVW